MAHANGNVGATAEQVKGVVDAGRDFIKDTAGDVKDRVVDAGVTVRHKLSDAKDVVADASGSALSATRSMIKEHPLIAVGVAFGLGYVVMRIMRH